MTYHKSFLKWAGGKYAILHKILPFFPPAKRFLEPFAGSASVFLNTHFEQSILAELNPDLVHLYNHIKLEAETFIPFCRQYFIPENNTAAAYYDLREQFNHCKDDFEKSAIFLYLNKHGYNGLCRYNQKGLYNVPFGFHKKPYFPEMEMQYFHQKSSEARFIVSDYQQTFTLAEPGDLIYCDPPYIPLSRTAKFTTYAGRDFTLEDQIQLASLARNAASRNITVIISNHDTPEMRRYYKDADIKSFLVKRHISCKGLQRKSVKELLAIFK